MFTLFESWWVEQEITLEKGDKVGKVVWGKILDLDFPSDWIGRRS